MIVKKSPYCINRYNKGEIRVTTLILVYLAIYISISTIILSCYNGQAPSPDQISPTKLQVFIHQSLQYPFTPTRALFIANALATYLIKVVKYILQQINKMSNLFLRYSDIEVNMEIKNRQLEIIKILQNEKMPISGGKLALMFHVTRQVIVKDISILKAEGYEIISTNKGYKLNDKDKITFIIKSTHDDSRIKEELNTIVDGGGRIVDVFVNHKTYGTIRKDLDIKSRNGVDSFLKSIDQATPLKNLTANIHYHTVEVNTYEDKKIIEENLRSKGFLVD